MKSSEVWIMRLLLKNKLLMGDRPVPLELKRCAYVLTGGYGYIPIEYICITATEMKRGH